MKGQISRISHNPQKGYSGVFHTQGGMITDGDLNEAAHIERSRLEYLGNDTIRDGVPAKGGIIGDANNGADGKVFAPYLRPGIVYADGVRGEVLLSGGKQITEKDGLELLQFQLDLPATVALPSKGEHIIYADIWQRTVHPLEDARLAEVAFHGAVTSFRQKTMTQLKTAPKNARSSIENGAGSFVQIGTGKLAVMPVSDAETGDICDPCANEIPLDLQVENALFRIEVVAVQGTASNPKSVTLAWSRENAAESAPVDALPDGFEDRDHVYEHTNLEIEQHKGIFADQDVQKVSRFKPEVNKTDNNFYARRWDGHCKFNLKDKAGPTLGRDTGVLIDGQPQINTEFFAARIDFENESVMIGDYWLIELRSNAQNDETSDERVYVVSKNPLGILHHYTVLLNVEDGEILPLSDKKMRALTFPTLSDIPADHVSYKNNCKKAHGPLGKTGGTLKNVQQALDQLCQIDAADIDFKSANCDILKDADTVEDALNTLCELDFGKGTDRSWMKYVFDWGVICGLTVSSTDQETVLVLPGIYFDWQGAIIETDWTSEQNFNIKEIRFDFVPGAKDWCLGIERFDEVNTNLVIAPKEKFTPAGGGTFAERVYQCGVEAEGKSIYDGTLEKLPQTEADLFKKVLATTVTNTWKTNPLELELQDAKLSYKVLGNLADTYKEANGGDRAAKLEAELARVKETYKEDGLVGLALKQNRGKEVAEMLSVLAAASSDLQRACICKALWPDCPDKSAKDNMVPLAGVDIEYSSTNDNNAELLGVFNICMVSCRRQALTPRSISYYLREHIAQQIGNTMERGGTDPNQQNPAADYCCGDEGKIGVPLSERPQGYVLGPVAGQQPRTRYKLDGKTKEAALDILSGNGMEIAEVIDLSAESTPARLAEIIGKGSLDERLTRAEAIGAGDRVVVLIDDGIVRGYLVDEYGNGKYPYEPLSRRIAMEIPPITSGESTEKLEGKLTALAKQLEAAEATASTLDAGISETLAQHKQAFTALSDEIGTNKTTLADIEARSTELQDKLDAQLTNILETGLGDEADAMRGILGALAQKLGTLDTSHGALANSIQTSDVEINGLEGRLAALGGRVSEVGSQIKGMSSDGIEPVLADAEARLVALRAGLAGEDVAANKLEQSASSARSALQGIGRELPEVLQSVDTLSEVFATVRTEAETLMATRARTDEEHAQLLEAQAELNETFLQKSATNLEFIKANLAELSQRSTSIESTIGSADSSLNTLEKQRSEALSQAQIELQALVNESTSSIARLGEDIGSTSSAARAILAQTKEDLDTDIRALDAKRTALSTKIIDLDEQLGGVEAKIGQQAEVLQRMTQSELQLQQKISASQDALKALSAEKSNLLAAIRSEHPASKLKGAHKTRVKTMAIFGLITVGDILSLTNRQIEAIAKENKNIAEYLAEARGGAADYLKQ